MNDKLDHISIPIREYLWLKWFTKTMYSMIRPNTIEAYQKYYIKHEGGNIPKDWKV